MPTLKTTKSTLRRQIMPTVKLGPKHQITIPLEIYRKLNLEVGDILEAEERGEGIFLIPQKLIPKDQAWFFSEEWQTKEREADKDIKEGRVRGPYDNIKDLLKDLKS